MDKVAFSIILILTFSQSLNGQTCVFGGMSLPIGNFASTDSATGGFAKKGYAIGAEKISRFYFGSEIGLSGILCYHPYDKIALIKSQPHLPPESPIEAGPWLLIWPMGSLGYSFSLNQNVISYARGHGGVFYGIYPEITVVERGTKFTQNMAIKFTWGWGIGCGLIIYEKIDFGVRFLAARPEYDLNTQGGGTSTSKKPTQQTEIIIVYLGVVL
ncbi:MAG: hypothetical protein QME52_03340 [Bacteroidota bacterium]|nr:hypothetical protein [Bacteroidota bacterium]